MVGVLARSRIGFWTMFVDAGVVHLNARDPGTLATVTIPLRATEVSVLAGDSDDARELARRIVEDVSRRSAIVLDTPMDHGIDVVVHEWESTVERDLPRRLAA